MVETIEQIQRRPEYIEQREKALLDQVFGQYNPDTGRWEGGMLQQPGMFEIPEYRFTGASPLQTEAFARALSPEFAGRYQPYFDAASEFMTGAGGALTRGLGTLSGAEEYFQPARDQLEAGTGRFDPSDVSAYMDPYRQQVIDEAMKGIEREGDVARQRAAAQAVGQGAFGGSRAGVQAAETERAIADVKGSTLAKLLSSGYSEALGRSIETDEAARRRALESGRLMGGLGSAYGQLGSAYGQLGGTYGTLGGTTADIGRVYGALAPADISTLSTLGGIERDISKEQVEVGRREYMRPFETAAFPIQYGYGVLSGTPSANLYGNYTYQPSANPFVSGLGAYSAIQGISQ